MKYPMYSYRDVKVGFTPPQADQNDGTAIRGFKYALNNKDGVMNYSPKDFDLYRVGEFDTDKGLLITLKVPQLICSGASAVGD